MSEAQREAERRYPHRNVFLEGAAYMAEERSRVPLRDAFVAGAEWQASRAPQPTEDDREALANLIPLGFTERDPYRDIFEAADAILSWMREQGFRRAPAEPAEVEVTEAMVERAVEFHYPLLMTGTQAEYERRYDNYGEGVRAIHQAQAKADVRAALRAAFATRGTDDE